MELLSAASLSVRTGATIDDWGHLSAFLYSDNTSDYTIEKAWVYRNLWREFHPVQSAEQWILPGRADYGKLRRIKYLLREQLDSFALPVIMPSFQRPLLFHAFHLPDEDRMAIEGRLLTNVLRNGKKATLESVFNLESNSRRYFTGGVQMAERRKHANERAPGKRFSIYLPGYIVDRLNDYRNRQTFAPPVSRVIAKALEKLLKDEERRASRK